MSQQSAFAKTKTQISCAVTAQLSDQHLCFRFSYSTMLFLVKPEISSFLTSSVTDCIDHFESDLVENPEDQLFYVRAQICNIPFPGKQRCVYGCPRPRLAP